MKNIETWKYSLLLLPALIFLLALIQPIHVARTGQFDQSLPYAEDALEKGGEVTGVIPSGM